MLKVKDNVDLKELEKFGFILNNKRKRELYRQHAYKKVSGFDIIIETDSVYREIGIAPGDNYISGLNVSFHLDTLYDLIKADLVEKTND